MVETRTAPQPMTVTAVDVSATNVTGLGARHLVQSLLPALERAPGFRIERLHLPATGPLAAYRAGAGTEVRHYRRILPNALSRLLECTLLSGRIAGANPLLILGDIPVRHDGDQIVLVHTPHLLAGSRAGTAWAGFKYAVARGLFRLNLPRTRWLIVQTEEMKQRLTDAHPEVAGRVAVIAQPPPQWLLAGEVKRTGPIAGDGGLTLFYPAAAYPHKNHRLLGEFAASGLGKGLVDRILVTTEGPGPANVTGLIVHEGELPPAGMIAAYRRADALLFPSLEESYGLPLVEAMFIGLPIICADRPYAHALCGDGAIYFDPESAEALRDAVAELRLRLDRGWWPDWSEQCARLPRGWDAAAAEMLSLFGRRP